MRTNSTILKPKNPRLLVIGGSGRLGRLLRRAWGAEGPSGLRPVWQARDPQGFAGCGGPTLVFDPLAAPEAFRAAAQAADAVLALAGVTQGRAEDLALNSTLAQAAVAAAAGRPVFVASSAAVYGAVPPPGLCRETDRLHPATPYGQAKAAMEAAVAGAPGMVVLRIGNVAGADALLGRAAPPGGRVLHILPSGLAPQRSYIGPQALARALARLVRLGVAGQPLPEVLNLALPGVVAMDALLRAAGAGWRAEPAPDTLIERVELDTGRAVALGLVAETPATAAAILADLETIGGPA